MCGFCRFKDYLAIIRDSVLRRAAAQDVSHHCAELTRRGLARLDTSPPALRATARLRSEAIRKPTYVTEANTQQSLIADQSQLHHKSGGYVYGDQIVPEHVNGVAASPIHAR